MWSAVAGQQAWRGRAADEQRSAGSAPVPMILFMIRSIAGAGNAISAEFRRFERSAARVAAPEPDVVRETVEQLASKHAVAAQVAVIRTADQMTGELFNIWA
jgi:hypothetical protein